MAKVHYFQRYSQKENVVTNNTLLLFSRLYNESTARFEDFINELFAHEMLNLEIGLRFNQQVAVRNRNSVPDGSLQQNSIKVLIETKLYDNNDSSQIKRHLDGFDDEDSQIMLLINAKPVSNTFNSKVHTVINQFNEQHNKQIKYCSITFQDIIDAFGSVISDFDVELGEILDDYREFCISEGLLPQHHNIMRAITSSGSFNQNMEFSIYYDAKERGYSPHKYIGLYKNKSVRAIGELQKVILADIDKTSKTITNIIVKHGSDVTESEKDRIVKIATAALDENGWDVFKNHQFFIVDKFIPTNYKKTSKYPIQRTKFFNLAKRLELESLPSLDKLAEMLESKTWE